MVAQSIDILLFRQAHPPLNKIWEFSIDNIFAEDVLRDKSLLGLISTSLGPTGKLCELCRSMRFWDDDFRIVDRLQDLFSRSKSCDFCNLRLEVCKHLKRNHTDGGPIYFDILGSNLRLDERYPPVLTIQTAPGRYTNNAFYPHHGSVLTILIRIDRTSQ